MATVRLATKDDLEIFRQVWREYLESQEDIGDFIRATDRTMSKFECAFLRCIDTSKGIVVLAEHDGNVCGILMRSIVDLPFETTLGKTAISFGAYVKKKFQNQGIYRQMVDLAAQIMQLEGVETVVSEVLTSNKIGDAASNSVGYSIEKTSRILKL